MEIHVRSREPETPPSLTDPGLRAVGYQTRLELAVRSATPKNMPHTIRLSGAAIAIVCRLSRDTPKSVAAEAPRRATVCARVSSRAQAHQSPP